jgi:hypothetical protein
MTPEELAHQTDIARTMRRIRDAKIEEPGPEHYVDRCDWSKTGFALWLKDKRCCTCRPTDAPVGAQPFED